MKKSILFLFLCSGLVQGLLAAAAPIYSIEEKIQDNRTIREFRDQNGKVFGIGWAGISILDPYQAISRYWKSETAAGPQISQKDIIIEKHGKRSFFWGKIYVPKYVPEGMNPDSIK